MKVILKQDVKNLGPAGKAVEVAEGYARNYLIPRGLATVATAGNLKVLEQQKQADANRKAKEEQEAEKLSTALSRVEVVIGARTGEGGKLFGSVTAKDVADALQRDNGLVVDKRKIELAEPIKALGTYKLTARLHPRVTAEIKVRVVEG